MSRFARDSLHEGKRELLGSTWTLEAVSQWFDFLRAGLGDSNRFPTQCQAVLNGTTARGAFRHGMNKQVLQAAEPPAQDTFA